jgi:hypothetical protein
METTKKIRWVTEDSWIATLANLLPLWLLSLAITAEGFSDPTISPELGITASVLAIVVVIVLLWKWWLPFDVLLVSFVPFLLLFKFDEISTSYKTPFILLCALILSIGIVGAQRSRSVSVRWLILLFVAVAVLVLSSNAVQNYWQMVSDLGYHECMPDYPGCAPLTGNETPWWVLFFSLLRGG